MYVHKIGTIRIFIAAIIAHREGHGFVTGITRCGFCLNEYGLRVEWEWTSRKRNYLL